MAFKVTLDSIREGIEKKYQSFDIEFGDDTLVLENPMRLSKTSRDAMLEVQKTIAPEKPKNGDEPKDVELDDVKMGFQEIIRITAKDKGVAESFIDEVAELGDPDELLILSDVFSAYMESTQAGEASPSDS